MPWTNESYGGTYSSGYKIGVLLAVRWLPYIWIKSFVAGIGNYLRSEILFHSRVNPFDRPKDLTRRQLGTLARNTLDLTRQAYATAGVTNTPGRVKRLQARGCPVAATALGLRSPKGVLLSMRRYR